MFGGVALVDKPLDLTSFGVVARIRRVFKEEVAGRVGHTGTLDPLATGLLPICIGEATKFAQRMLDADKGYLATIKLGAATESGDREGAIIATGSTDFSAEQIDAALNRFAGKISQTPPKFSALKIDGRPAYELARAGKEVQLAAREVTIHSIKRLAHRPADAAFDIEVVCSKGTYIRSLAVDIGEALGTVAHLAALRRTMTGGFTLEQAKPLEAWMNASKDERAAWLLPVDSLVADLPRIDLDESDARAIRNGKLIADVVVAIQSASYRLYGPRNAFLGLGEFASQTPNVLRAQRLMATGAS
ncbi:MAG: tRNA pseudouridine(55) synthase TruB [Casimicrobium sp.]